MGAPVSRATFQDFLEERYAAEEVPVASKEAWKLFKDDVPAFAVRVKNLVDRLRRREEHCAEVWHQPLRCAVMRARLLVPSCIQRKRALGLLRSWKQRFMNQ